MKRYIRLNDAYPSLVGKFPYKIKYHSESGSDDEVEIKLSYKTALLFINGQNVCSFYPTSTSNPEFWVKEIQESCEDYGHPISKEKALALTTYMIDNIR